MKSRFFLSLLVLVCLSACSSVRIVNTEANDGFALSQYQTFNFYEVDAQGGTQSIDYNHSVEMLKTEIAKQLTRRGLTQRTEQPDLLVNLGIVVEEKVQTRQTNYRTDAPRYIGQRRYSWRSEEVEVGRYKEGTVTVHLIDRAQNKLMWLGVAAGVIPHNLKKRQEDIAEGAEKLFNRLPSPAQAAHP